VQCRENKENHGQAPDKIKANKALHSGNKHQRFRQKSIKVQGTTCVLTGVSFDKIDGGKYLEFHHPNAKTLYPEHEMDIEWNSIPLCRAVHRSYHYLYLGSFDLEYDPISETIEFSPDANVFTFILFLEQLKRDITIDKTCTLLKKIQDLLEEEWQCAVAEGLTKSPCPIITADKIDGLIARMSDKNYTNYIADHPATKKFFQSYHAHNFPLGNCMPVFTGSLRLGIFFS
jgi:hypothetical protein